MSVTPRKKRRTSPAATAELLSASTSSQQPEAAKTLSPKGQTTPMRELVQIDSPSEHACGQPSIERLHVLEPVSGRWSWVRLFGCCNQVVFEPLEDDKDKTRVKRAA
jgi:hypothetical protein